jgi:hypothetical protein
MNRSYAFGLGAIAVLVAACGDRADEMLVERPADPAVLEGDPHAAALEAVQPADYSEPEAWLCRPDAMGACDADMSTTIVSADGVFTAEVSPPAAAAPEIDCFYVYPTVSLDASPNSDMTPGPEEAAAAQQQFARFRSVCRTFAPLYRQVTLPALRALLRGEKPATNREMAYADIRAAWRRYMESDNHGRGFVLIGHSQGAGLLTRLIANEIDGQPSQQQLVSAILLGSALSVPSDGSGVGGSFRQIGLCVSDEDLGCAIAYSTFRAEKPPTEGALFGRAAEAGMKAACVNPSILRGSDGALRAYLPTTHVMDVSAAPTAWTIAGEAIATPFAAVPGLLRATCTSRGGYDYLAIETTADPADARTDVIAGDIVVDGQVRPEWGLHLYDVNFAIGDLVDIVREQGRVYAARQMSQLQHPAEPR